MSVLNWARQIVAGSASASPFQTNVMMAIIPANSTVLRTIVTFDWWMNSTTAEFVEIGEPIAYGVSLGSSSTAPDYHPYTDFAATGSPNGWLYLDQMGTVEQFAEDVAGTIQYVVKNDTTSRHIDTRTQRKNDTGAARYLWFGIEPDVAGVAGFSNVYWSVASQILYQSPT